MRLLKQSFLYFNEGNSDKVYEIDLCELGGNKFVVNFRYGRRGSALKEGSKTPIPVTLAEAEKIFDLLETEKLLKGYSSSATGQPITAAKTTLILDTGNDIIRNNFAAMPASRNKAILQRLHNAANGRLGEEKFPWKLSRIIWKAGEYNIKEASPYIIKLFNNGNQLHQYCCVWALARCCGDNTNATAILKEIHTAHPVASIAKLAGAGLVKNLSGLEKETQLNRYLNKLPEPFKNLVEAGNIAELENMVRLRMEQQQPNYNWLEDIYLLSVEKRGLRNVVKKVLKETPLRPNYFKHIRAIFKLAELLDDFEITGLLACRFEREEEMFRHHLSFANSANQEVYVPLLEEWVKLRKELKKTTSRLAYSQKTRWYFHARVLRKLQTTGKNDDTNYVKLATALLIGYDFKKDFREHFSTFNYVYRRNTYEKVETRYLQNAQAVFLHQVLSGDNPEIRLQPNHLWRMHTADEKSSSFKQIINSGAATEMIGGFLKKLTGFFGNKKDNITVAPKGENIAAAQANLNKDGTPFLHLWNKVPQAYVQLLMDAELEEIHQFAESNLIKHQDFEAIKRKLDKHAVKQFLSSPFAIPARFGLTLALEKYSHSTPDEDLVIAALNSVNEAAQNKGKQWAELHRAMYLAQSNFVAELIFAKNAGVRIWANGFLKSSHLPAEIRSTVVGKSVAQLLSYKDQNAENEIIIGEASNTLFELFTDELKQVNIEVIADMLGHENGAVLLFGLRILKIQKPQLELNTLSGDFLAGLLHHSHELVREEGISLLLNMSEAALLLHAGELIMGCLSNYENVRRGLPLVIERLAKKDNAFGIEAAEALMPVLLRKESSEGLHADVSKLLCNELSDYLQNANKTTALNLLYSNYSAAQNVGVVILEKYTDASQLTLPQVVALGGHENLNVREWCWKFYNQQPSRIKYEKDRSIKLLESKWQDSRQFAMQYFREQFSNADWNPETLISLADSVKPDVEAFGRELITKFFTTENGIEYLLKLSQHPSEKMQLFATNYLERFATDDVEKIQDLEFYFRSVLTRVNKSRIAKNRIYLFLLNEGRKSEAAAKITADILADISAIAAIGDKAKCIDLLLQLKALYDIDIPVKIKETETRRA